MENNNLEINLYVDYAKKQHQKKFLLYATDVILDIIKNALNNKNTDLIIMKHKNGYAKNVLVEWRY